MLNMTRLCKISFILAIVLSTSLFAEMKKAEKLDEPSKNVQTYDSKIVIGSVENILIEPPSISLKARIDTGATTTSIDARNMVPFERDGKKWVKFSIIDGKEEYKLEQPIARQVRIKRHGKKAQERYVIKMRVSAGNKTQLIEVTLVNRSEYRYPILIGRNFLQDYFLVDVSQKYTLTLKTKGSH